MGIKFQKGFTLLELVLVLGVMAFILPALFNIFLLTSRSQMKVYVLQNVKRNGDDSLSTIQSLIKARALSIQIADGSQVCSTAASTYSSGDLYFVDADGNRFRFYLDGTKIASESSTTGVTDLTTDAVAITDFSMTCQRESSFTPPLVSLSFQAAQAVATSRAEESATMDYQTKIRLRSY